MQKLNYNSKKFPKDQTCMSLAACRQTQLQTQGLNICDIPQNRLNSVSDINSVEVMSNQKLERYFFVVIVSFLV